MFVFLDGVQHQTRFITAAQADWGMFPPPPASARLQRAGCLPGGYTNGQSPLVPGHFPSSRLTQCGGKPTFGHGDDSHQARAQSPTGRLRPAFATIPAKGEIEISYSLSRTSASRCIKATGKDDSTAGVIRPTESMSRTCTRSTSRLLLSFI
jgi:hypothetical protein